MGEGEAGWERGEERAKEGVTCAVKGEGEKGKAGERGKGVPLTGELQSRRPQERLAWGSSAAQTQSWCLPRDPIWPSSGTHRCPLSWE